MRTRLTDSIEMAYREAGGTAFAIEDPGLPAEAQGAKAVRKRTSSASGSSVRTATSPTRRRSRRLFSFNNPFGACPTCHGFGNIIELDLDLVVPDPDQVDSAGRHRAVDEDALPRAARRAQAGGEAGRRVDGHPVERPERRREALHRRGRRQRLRRHPRVLPLARAQEIQGARSRVPQPVSRLSDVSRLRRRPPAPRGARRQGRRPHDRSGVVRHRSRGAAVPRGPAAHRERSGDRRQGAEGDSEAAEVPQRRRARII